MVCSNGHQTHKRDLTPLVYKEFSFPMDVHCNSVKSEEVVGECANYAQSVIIIIIP